MRYTLTVSGPDPSLITLPTSTQASLAFAASSSTSDAGTYTVTISAGYEEQTSDIASQATTFTYVSPCPTTSLLWAQAPVAMHYSVSATALTQTVSMNDLISIARNIANSCGLYTYSISDSPSSGVSTLTTDELTISAGGVISVQTTNQATAGVHTVSVDGFMETYTNVAISRTFTLTITACIV